jgi:hypothetical protein
MATAEPPELVFRPHPRHEMLTSIIACVVCLVGGTWYFVAARGTSFVASAGIAVVLVACYGGYQYLKLVRSLPREVVIGPAAIEVRGRDHVIAVPWDDLTRAIHPRALVARWRLVALNGGVLEIVDEGYSMRTWQLLDHAIAEACSRHGIPIEDVRPG